MEGSTSYNEKELLVQVANGDENAFRQIYDQYRKKIYAYVSHLTGSAELADEVVQEIFLKVWLHRHKLHTVQLFSAWLYAITRHYLFDALKRSARETLAKKELAHSIPAFNNNTDENVLQKENDQLLQQALNQLSTQQQLIYHLSRNQGLKYEEIATRLKIAPNTVKVHIVNALRTIREYIRFHSMNSLLLLFLWY